MLLFPQYIRKNVLQSLRKDPEMETWETTWSQADSGGENDEQRKEVVPAAALSYRKLLLTKISQAKCPKAKPGALISHSVFPCPFHSLSLN